MIGEKIKKAIEKSDFSAEQIAGRAGMSLTNLYKVYKRDSIETRYLTKIAEALGLPFEYFLTDESEKGTANTTITQTGNNNAGRDFHQQKNINTGHEGTNNPISDDEGQDLLLKYKLCEQEREGLKQQLLLKDQIINMKDEQINSWKLKAQQLEEQQEAILHPEKKRFENLKKIAEKQGIKMDKIYEGLHIDTFEIIEKLKDPELPETLRKLSNISKLHIAELWPLINSGLGNF